MTTTTAPDLDNQTAAPEPWIAHRACPHCFPDSRAGETYTRWCGTVAVARADSSEVKPADVCSMCENMPRAAACGATDLGFLGVRPGPGCPS